MKFLHSGNNNGGIFCGGKRRYSDQATGRTIRDSNPSRDKKYHTGCRAHPTSCSEGTGFLSQKEGRRGPDVDRSPPSAIKVKNEWSCSCVPSMCLDGVDRTFYSFFYCYCPSFSRGGLRVWFLLQVTLLRLMQYDNYMLSWLCCVLNESKMSHPRCVYINNRCRYQSITQQYLKNMFNKGW